MVFKMSKAIPNHSIWMQNFITFCKVQIIAIYLLQSIFEIAVSQYKYECAFRNFDEYSVIPVDWNSWCRF